MLVCDTFEELPQEIRARVRLGDPTLVCIRYHPLVSPGHPSMPGAEGLLLADVLNHHAPNQRHGWIERPVHVHPLAVWLSHSCPWECVEHLNWLEPRHANFVEP